MGICLSCCNPNPDKDYGGNPTVSETSRLIDPASNTHSQSQRINGDTFATPVPETAPPKGDEQSALTRILHKTARNVIDVAALEGQNIEQHEYHDKARHYSNRANMVLGSTNRPRGYRPSLPSGTSNPQNLLGQPPISLGDIELITAASQKAVKAMKDVKVEHKEELVVPFGVP